MNTTRFGKTSWSNELLDNGAAKTQEKWIVWCKKNGWRLPTIAEYIELFKQLNDGEFRENLCKDLGTYWLMTADKWGNPYTKECRPCGFGSLGGSYVSAYGYFINSGRARGIKK